MDSCFEKSRQQPKTKVTPLVFIALLPIRFYRFFISPMLGPRCRFEPSCSHYAEDAIKNHGILLGMWYSIKRLSRCHPWSHGGYDPVPPVHKNSSNLS